ncbi:hypothetical protein VNO77_18356 [Canavalia gladiata]|uniref:PDZ domain-containing protein n=1 Tax=Canavalia gladiata TaxID=3824 RepID=A0AAN9LKN3_CANGL
MVGRFKRSCVVGAVSIAAFGSSLLCSNNNNGYRTSVTARLTIQDSPFSTWPPLHAFFRQPEMLAPYSYRVSPLPSSYISKEASGDVCDGSKPSGCFGKDTIANAVAKVRPAVVYISIPEDFFGIHIGMRICSGTIINKDGTILTCAYVFNARGWISLGKFLSSLVGLWLWMTQSYGGFKYDLALLLISSIYDDLMLSAKGDRWVTHLVVGFVEVTLLDGRRFEGKVLNIDRHSDIAIVKINSDTLLPEAKIGSSSELCPGDWVIAMGCPMYLKNTVTAGIVSRIGRKSSELGFSGVPREYLQTNCACTLGNSGGPLVNMDGEVVGMNITQVRDDDELSFSLPIEFVCKIIEHFKKSRRVAHPWLGLQTLDLNEIFIAQLKKNEASFPNVNKGILVLMLVHNIISLLHVAGSILEQWLFVDLGSKELGVDVEKKVTRGSPGDRAGFCPGDVVIEFDGKPIESMDEVIEILGDKVGVPVKVLVKRAGDELVTLTVIPEESNLDR